jgi:hypothetical protein
MEIDKLTDLRFRRFGCLIRTYVYIYKTQKLIKELENFNLKIYKLLKN